MIIEGAVDDEERIRCLEKLGWCGSVGKHL